MAAILLFWEEGIKETVCPSLPLTPASKSSSEVFVKQLTCGYSKFGMNVVMIVVCILNVAAHSEIHLRDQSFEISPLCSTGYCCT